MVFMRFGGSRGHEFGQGPVDLANSFRQTADIRGVVTPLHPHPQPDADLPNGPMTNGVTMETTYPNVTMIMVTVVEMMLKPHIVLNVNAKIQLIRVIC